MHRIYAIFNHDSVISCVETVAIMQEGEAPMESLGEGEHPAGAPVFGLGERLRRVYGMLGGQERVAELIGVAKGTPGRWARGESRMSLDDAARLCGAADVSLEWLAYGGPLRSGRSEWLEAGAVVDSAELVIELARELEQPVESTKLARTIRDRAASLTRERHAMSAALASSPNTARGGSLGREGDDGASPKQAE